VYYFGNIIFGGILQPKFMSPGDWNLKGKTVSVLDGRSL
jgi:SP family general alpha glucoside:H+ symporter-like MFS transporter